MWCKTYQITGNRRQKICFQNELWKKRWSRIPLRIWKTGEWTKIQELNNVLIDAEKNSDRTSSESSWSSPKRTTPQSNPRKQEVIPATNFEYSKICVILNKVASSEDKMKINSELLLSCKLIKCLQNNVRKWIPRWCLRNNILGKGNDATEMTRKSKIWNEMLLKNPNRVRPEWWRKMKQKKSSSVNYYLLQTSTISLDGFSSSNCVLLYLTNLVN